VKLPWISREHHHEVVAAKDALILSLEAHNAVLAERLEKPIAVTVHLPKDFAMVQPAVVRHKQKHTESPAPTNEVPPIDWATVNPGDNFQMAQLAAQELGQMVSGVQLDEWLRMVRRKIAIAKSSGSPGLGTVGTVGSPQVPEHILTKIAEAERV